MTAAGDGGGSPTVLADRSALLDPLPDSQQEPLLEVDGLSVTFPTDDGEVKAVRGVSYTVRPGEVLAIVGESGSGKSVSSMAVMGLLPRSARVTGSVRFRGRDVLRMRADERRALRGKSLGMIFQDPMTAMNPVLTVGDQLAEAVRVHNRVSYRVALKQALEMLTLVGIPQAEKRLRAYPHEFSGGMRQRAMIAMAVINKPDVIFADEPTTALDVTVQAQILDTILDVKDAVGAAVVFITHDLAVVASIAHRVLVMYAGRPVEVGDVDDVFYRPRMPYTLGLLASIPDLSGDRDRLVPIIGAPPSLLSLPVGCPFRPRCRFADDACLIEPDLVDVTATHDVPAPGGAHTAACHRPDAVAAVAAGEASETLETGESLETGEIEQAS